MLQLLMALFSLSTLAAVVQDYPFVLKGMYKLGPNRAVTFTLQWEEKNNGRAEGVYSDDYLGDRAPLQGSVDSLGRTFVIRLKAPVKGVSSLVVNLPLSSKEEKSASVPVSLVSRDLNGSPIMTVKTSALLKARAAGMIAQKQEEIECVEGFGVLANFCGVYSGLISEDMDRRNKCNLLFADAVRLELKNDSSLVLHLGEPSDLFHPAFHLIGRLPVDPKKDFIDVMSRVCTSLVGLNSRSDSCKILHITGRFTIQDEVRRFTGTYQISEEGTNTSCRYSLSMEKKFAQ